MISTKKPTTQTKKTTLRIPLPQKATPTPIRTSTRFNSTRLDNDYDDVTSAEEDNTPSTPKLSKPYNKHFSKQQYPTLQSNNGMDRQALHLPSTGKMQIWRQMQQKAYQHPTDHLPNM